MSKPEMQVGGQAVIEGVMMRCKEQLTIAVRCPNQEISLHKEVLNPVANRWPLLKLPILRGVVAFIEMLFVGTRALTHSANVALEEEEEELTPLQLTLTVALALTLGIGLFILVPTIIMRFVQGLSPETSSLVFNLGEGLVRILILVGYVSAISRLSDIQRVFQYHGAEHKAVHCFEAGEDLVVEKARTFSPLHPRCGTAFLLVVVFISILLFSFFGWPGLIQRIVLRLLLLPLVAGLAYEIIKAAGKSENPILKAIIMPGLLLQKLTTKEPDDSQIEVALKALKGALGREEEVEEVVTIDTRGDSHAR